MTEVLAKLGIFFVFWSLFSVYSTLELLFRCCVLLNDCVHGCLKLGCHGWKSWTGIHVSRSNRVGTFSFVRGGRQNRRVGSVLAGDRHGQVGACERVFCVTKRF